MTAGFEHFSEWKKIDDENEPGLIRLETMIRGVCEKRKLLDFVEELHDLQRSEGRTDEAGREESPVPWAWNNAIAAVGRLHENRGKLGVFWHTQGSGKSYSMVFFSQKVLRTIPGNWTFVIVTDREDLDGQIYRNFANTGALLEDEKAGSRGERRRFAADAERRRPPLCVHADPEVPHRARRTLPGSLDPLGTSS